jgi:NhaP-type Na+/H+ or K+/H+ antiporter
VFLALGGALLAFLPGAPSFTVPPELALALFIAPVLLDAAYDASLRDLKDNWAPIASLVVVAVGLTTIAVALVARSLLPEMPWAPAIALGAVVAPPDAAAATAVLRPMRPPRRILTILEGESLLNDASALLIYRLAVGAAVTHDFSVRTVAPTFIIAVAGSLVAGPALGWLFLQLVGRVQHVPTSIYIAVAGIVLLTVIVARAAWHMSFNTVIRWRHRRRGFHPPRPMLRPTFGSGLIISWAGMRGILSLAAAMALPEAFPYRDLIVLTAFFVVVGTLAIQGLTLKPLLNALRLQDDDPVSRELSAARERALHAGLAALEHDKSPAADAIREEFAAHLIVREGANSTRSPHGEIHRAALQAARRAVLLMRANDEIGDDAFHVMEEELDWLEMAVGGEHE